VGGGWGGWDEVEKRVGKERVIGLDGARFALFGREGESRKLVSMVKRGRCVNEKI